MNRQKERGQGFRKEYRDTDDNDFHLVATKWTGTLDKTIRKETLVSFAVKLSDCILHRISILIRLVENILGNIRLVRGSSTSKMIEIHIKPFITHLVNGMILVADGLAAESFLESLGLGGCSVFIGTANEHGVVALQTTVSINRQH